MTKSGTAESVDFIGKKFDAQNQRFDAIEGRLDRIEELTTEILTRRSHTLWD